VRLSDSAKNQISDHVALILERCTSHLLHMLSALVASMECDIKLSFLYDSMQRQSPILVLDSKMISVHVGLMDTTNRAS